MDTPQKLGEYLRRAASLGMADGVKDCVGRVGELAAGVDDGDGDGSTALALARVEIKSSTDFNVRVIERFDPDSSAVLRELDESNRFVQKSAESTSICPS